MPNKSGTSTLSSRIKLVWADHTTSQLVLTSGVAHHLLQPVKPLAKYLAVPLHFLSCSIHVRKCSGSPRGCEVLVPLVAARSWCPSWLPGPGTPRGCQVFLSPCRHDIL